MTRYRVESKDHEETEREFDERDQAIEWAVGLVDAERPRVRLYHYGQGEWERIGVYDHHRGSA